MAKEKDASFWAFARAFRQHWWAAMSGSFSVPFAALGEYFAFVNQNGLAAFVFAALAFCAVWFAAYVIWRGERERVIELETKIEGSASSRARLALSEIIAIDPYGSSARIWHMRVNNAGSAAADNVIVKLAAVRARPHAVGWDKVVLPLTVPAINTTVDMGGARINQGDGETYLILHSGPHEAGGWNIWGYGHGALSSPQAIHIQTFESLELTYKVTAANADTLTESLVLRTNAVGLTIDRKG